MTLKQKEEIIRLERIAKLRLYFSKRWSKVSVFIDNKNVVVYWHGPKGTEWESHRKERSITEIHKYLRSQESKLRTEFKNRHNLNELKP
jgi:hypothetical protein